MNEILERFLFYFYYRDFIKVNEFKTYYLLPPIYYDLLLVIFCSLVETKVLIYTLKFEEWKKKKLRIF